MKKLIVCLLTSLVLMGGSVQCSQPEPFLAVYCSPDLTAYWDNKEPDLIQEASTWDDFKLFCYRVNQEAGDRPVIVDIDIHGDRQGFLYICNGRGGDDYVASEGYLLNQLDKIENLQLILQESCFAGVVFKNSLRPVTSVTYNGNCVEAYTGGLTHPVMGVDNVLNYNASIHDQFRTGYRLNYHDLREYTFRDPGAADPDEHNPKCESLKWFVRSIRLFEELKKA